MTDEQIKEAGYDYADNHLFEKTKDVFCAGVKWHRDQTPKWISVEENPKEDKTYLVDGIINLHTAMKEPKKVYIDRFGIDNFDYGLSCNAYPEGGTLNFEYISVEHLKAWIKEDMRGNPVYQLDVDELLKFINSEK